MRPRGLPRLLATWISMLRRFCAPRPFPFPFPPIPLGRSMSSLSSPPAPPSSSAAPVATPTAVKREADDEGDHQPKEQPEQPKEQPEPQQDTKRPKLSSSNATSDERPIVSDAKFGIVAYMTEGIPGFQAILKERYTDFLVNEVDLKGNVCHLTQLTFAAPVAEAAAPKQEEDGMVVDVIAAPPANADDVAPPPSAAATTNAPVVDHRGLLVDLVGEETVARLDKLEQQAVLFDKFPLTMLKEATRDNKMKIHGTVKQLYVHITTETAHGTIMIMHKSKSTRSWPAAGGGVGGDGNKKPAAAGNLCYTHFNLYKENKDTMEAIQVLVSLTRSHKKLFTVAGTKDKRGITVQRVSAKNITPQRLQGLNARLRGMQVGNFSLEADELKLGQLRGNRFVITLRNVTGDDASVIRSVSELQAKGFVNYFGMQRFGTATVPTCAIGCHILRSDWAGAVDLILRPREGDSMTGAARKAYVNRNYKDARDLLPVRCHIERTLLQSLCVNDRDFHGALFKLQRNMRLMYVHSFQSLIWNKMATLRLQRYGTKPVVGDLVYSGSDGSWASEEADEAAAELLAAEEGATNDEVEPATASSSSASTTAARTDTHRPLAQVLVLDESNVDKYSLSDVVLPLPGFAVQYPGIAGFQAEYEAAMALEGVEPSHLRHSVREFSLVGGYRKLVGTPKDFEWSLLRYNDRQQQLVLTDWDVLQGKPPVESTPDGRLRALRVSFTLPPSSYATMVLRELFKTETSSAFQANLSKSINPATTL